MTREERINSLPNISFVRWLDPNRTTITSRAVVRCDIDGLEWHAIADNLLRGKGCPKCYGNYRYTEHEQIERIHAAGVFTFVRWATPGEHRTCHKAVVRCVEGHEVSAVVGNIVRGSGCLVCQGGYTRNEPELNREGVRQFVRWVKPGAHTTEDKAVMLCLTCGVEWSARISNLLGKESGCRRCAKFGYDTTRPGAVYVLISECQRYIKVGISNRFKVRMRELRCDTPFKFEIFDVIKLKDGQAAKDIETMFHTEFESAGLRGFDGCTEWLRYDKTILELASVFA